MIIITSKFFTKQQLNQLIKYFEIGVTLAERHLLIELAGSPTSTMGEIAERLLLDKSTVRQNSSGRSSHIANAAYMIRSTFRGKGVGSLLIKAFLHLAKYQGFRAVQFNMVLSKNMLAVKLYQRLGFDIVGILSEAIQNPEGSYQDGYVMYRKLDILHNSFPCPCPCPCPKNKKTLFLNSIF